MPEPQKIEDENEELTCDECGQAMVINVDGTTNHLVEESEGVDSVDYDQDADHVPYHIQEDEDGPCGHCDTCGAPCDKLGCTKDRGHEIANEA